MSLLLVTALVAIWLACELSYIRERQAWIKENSSLLEPDPSAPPVVAHVPWLRILLGDEAVPTIEESDDWSADERGYVVKLFPEASLRKTLVYSLPVTGVWSSASDPNGLAIPLQKLPSAPVK